MSWPLSRSFFLLCLTKGVFSPFPLIVGILSPLILSLMQLFQNGLDFTMGSIQWSFTLLTTAQMALNQPGCLLQKVLGVKALGNIYNLAMSQVSYKKINTMVTKDWSTKIGLSRFPNNAHEPLLLTKNTFLKEKEWHSRKICMLPLSQYWINSLSYASTNVLWHDLILCNLCSEILTC